MSAHHSNQDVKMEEEIDYVALGNLPADDNMKRMLVDLQRKWLLHYHESREVAMTTLAEKIHQEYSEDNARIRRDLRAQFEQELEETKEEILELQQKNMEEELAKLAEKHRKELAQAKKQQWCSACSKEALYHCCWNTSYCSPECQTGHWQLHKKTCRRRKANGSSGAAQPARMQ